MARPSTAAQRSLTLTEELEKLEQSITLTLQEIDHNFSRAHRIVTSSILPIVEQYAEHSRDVWEGSKFWKQFFEASANVSLNGYEEAPDEDEDDQTITTNPDDEHDLLSQSTPDSRSASSFVDTPGLAKDDNDNNDNGDNGYDHSLAGSSAPPTVTPKKAAHRRTPSGKMEARHGGDHAGRSGRASPTPSSTLPATPRAQTIADDSMTEAETPQLPSLPGTAQKTPGTRGPNDMLLHRVLDKTYRVQATPMSRGASRQLATSQSGANTATVVRRDGAKPETPMTGRTGALNFDLDSSPMEEAPTIRAGLLQSASRKRMSGQKADWEAQRNRERVPGVSVLAGGASSKGDGDTSRISLGKAARQSLGRGTSFGFGPGKAAAGGGGGGGGWDSDSDDDADAFGGMSPPKTMAFNVPTSKLMQTPAREASRMIVQNLLATAGGENMTDTEDSPSIIQKQINYEEDTF